MSQVAGKVWGRSETIFALPAFELHRLTIHAGHRCSKHKHQAKFNGLYVEEGVIEVTVWQPEGTVDVTTVKAGESIVIPPGVFHQFRGVQLASVVFETYWTALSPADIIREDVGQ